MYKTLCVKVKSTPVKQRKGSIVIVRLQLYNGITGSDGGSIPSRLHFPRTSTINTPIIKTAKQRDPASFHTALFVKARCPQVTELPTVFC